jgi:hypothetical protein
MYECPRKVCWKIVVNRVNPKSRTRHLEDCQQFDLEKVNIYLLRGSLQVGFEIISSRTSNIEIYMDLLVRSYVVNAIRC